MNVSLALVLRDRSNDRLEPRAMSGRGHCSWCRLRTINAGSGCPRGRYFNKVNSCKSARARRQLFACTCTVLPVHSEKECSKIFLFFGKKSTGFFKKNVNYFLIFIKHFPYKTTCFKDKNILRKTGVFIPNEREGTLHSFSDSLTRCSDRSLP